MRKFYLVLFAFVFASTVGISTQGALAQESGYASAYLRNVQVSNSAAQYSSQRIQKRNLNQAVSRVGVAGINLRNFSSDFGDLATKQKPFSGVQLGPSVSPYLAMSNPFATSTDYYTIVKPLQEQRRQNERFAQQQYIQERKLNQIAARGPYSVQGDENATPTGHPVTRMYFANFNTTGNYFPPPTPSKREY